MKAGFSPWKIASVRPALLCIIVYVHLSVKLKMSHCELPALFPDILWGQFTSEKDTCLFCQDVQSGSDSLKDINDLLKD